ncbi:MAG: hypothetical protein QM658_17340 [Gordonia sp. (in: high G+C Gram-positive bacteria)]
MQAPQWVTLVVGVLAITGVLVTLWQRQLSEERDRAQRAEHDSRSEWWRRYVWAVELSLTEADTIRSATGVAVLCELADSPLATVSELGVIRTLALSGESDDNGDDRNGVGDVGSE